MEVSLSMIEAFSLSMCILIGFAFLIYEKGSR